MTQGKHNSRIPQGVFNTLGKGKLEKSRWGGNNNEKSSSVYLIAWDFAEKCTGSDCGLYDICVYKDKWKLKAENQHKSGATDKCMMQQRYLRNVISAFMSVANKSHRENEITEDNVIKLGYELIPLYAQLFKFKCFEYTNKNVVYTTEKGTPKMHPVYKEIRETIKTIAGIWKDVVPQKDAKKADPKGVGDTAFIDAVYGGDENETESKNGSGIDFDDSFDEETDETGSGIDFDKHSDIPDKVQKKQRSKKRRKKKTPGRRTRASKNVVKYDSRAKRSDDD